MVQMVLCFQKKDHEVGNLKNDQYWLKNGSERKFAYESEVLSESNDEAEVKSNKNDMLGMLSIPVLKLNEIVVQGKDNEFYLNHDADGYIDSYGCVFLDARNQLNDPLLIVYGHHVINENIRFSKLLDLFDEDKQEAMISFLGKNWRINGVVQTGITSGNDLFDPWLIDFIDEQHFKAYLRYLETLGDFRIDDYTGKQYLLLSTCLDIDSEERVLVLAAEE